MQSLDVISVNLWQMLVSLLNLLILFLLIKKFLYKPVKRMLENRQKTIDGDYEAAKTAREAALSEQKAYEEKLSGAKKEADGVIQSAVSIAKARENEILADAKQEAQNIIRQAKENAELEIRKAEESIKTEIVEVGTALSQKLLEREIKAEDHKKLIDSFIEEIGEENEGNL